MVRLDRLARADRSPPAAVHDLLDAAPAPAQRRRAAVVGAGVADGHAADRAEAGRHAERFAERRNAAPAGRRRSTRPGPRRRRSAASAAPPCRRRRPSTAPASGTRRGRSSPCPARRSGPGRRPCPTSARSAAARGASASASRPAAPPSVVAVQNRSRSSGVSSTRNAQPWLNPADGARRACSSSRSRTSGGTGRSGRSRAPCAAVARPQRTPRGQPAAGHRRGRAGRS